MIIYSDHKHNTQDASTVLLCLIFMLSKRKERRLAIAATLTIKSGEEELQGFATNIDIT